jgi:hypothetical protein
LRGVCFITPQEISQTEPCGELRRIIVGIETYGGMKKPREVDQRKKTSSG